MTTAQAAAPPGLKVGLCLLLTALATAGGWWLWHRHAGPATVESAEEDPDPGLDSPYLNTRRGVGYVGDQACAGCHAAISKKYHQTPMARSMGVVPAAGSPEIYDARAHNPFTSAGFRYAVERRDGEIVHKETLEDAGTPGLESSFPVAFALGSGKQGRAYLIQRGDGYLYESPVTWYADKQTWGLSPGYEKSNSHFSRPVSEDCLFCHANRVTPVKDSLNHFRRPVFDGLTIGCERCHGPGELHVKKHREPAADAEPEDFDHTIVNPRRLDPVRRDSVCQQCHFLGEVRVVTHGHDLFDFRPGLPYHRFIFGYTWLPHMADQLKSFNQTTQMEASRCYKASKGKLGCISCHEPHTEPAPAERVATFRKACLGCHTEQSCTVTPVARRARQADDSCIACHMPRNQNTDIVHSSVTDHRILRDPKKAAVREPGAGSRPGEIPLVHFHRALVDPQDPEASRSLGIAMTRKAIPMEERTRRFILEQALPRLQTALGRWPDDVPVLEAQGYALLALHRLDEAAEVLGQVLKRSPNREMALRNAARVAEERKDLEGAVRHWQRVTEVNPWFAEAHEALGRLYLTTGRRSEALRELLEAVRLDPADAGYRLLLLGAYVEQGERSKAREQYDVLRRLDPDRAGQMKRQYATFFQ